MQASDDYQEILQTIENATNLAKSYFARCGNSIVETENEIITLKNNSDVSQIVDYLHQNNLQDVIGKNFPMIDEQEFSLSKSDDVLNYLLDWSRDIQSFYENALKENCSVIFTVDL